MLGNFTARQPNQQELDFDPNGRQESRCPRIGKVAVVGGTGQMISWSRPSILWFYIDSTQVSLLTAADFWRSKSIPEKGIPAFKTSDGPNGARGAIFKAGTKVRDITVVCQSRGSNDLPQAALFPCGVSLAATWNKNILFSVGQHLADEAKARSAQVLLAPTVCLHRGPLGGRNFESFSEDPYLTGKLAASYINGLQGKGVAATIKREYLDRRQPVVTCLILVNTHPRLCSE
jgi:hypothetical protein